MQALGAFILITLAAAFVTWTITTSQVALPLRRAVVKRSGPSGWWTTLVHCPFCTGFWVAVPSAAYWILISHYGWFWFPIAIGAMAFLVPRLLAFDRES
jgi:hypothetical protein